MMMRTENNPNKNLKLRELKSVLLSTAIICVLDGSVTAASAQPLGAFTPPAVTPVAPAPAPKLPATPPKAPVVVAPNAPPATLVQPKLQQVKLPPQQQAPTPPPNLTADQNKLISLINQRDSLNNQRQQNLKDAQVQFNKDRNAAAYNQKLTSFDAQWAPKIQNIFQQMIGLNRTGKDGDDVTVADVRGANGAQNNGGGNNATPPANPNPPPKPNPIPSPIGAGQPNPNAPILKGLILDRQKAITDFQNEVATAQGQGGSGQSLLDLQVKFNNKIIAIDQKIQKVNFTGKDPDDIDPNTL
jgi:hypothetical protein